MVLWRTFICRRVLTMLERRVKCRYEGSLNPQALTSVKAKHFSFGLLVGAVVLGSCKPALKVTSEYDKAVDFDRYRTFAVAGTESLGRAMNQLNYDRVLAAVRSEMSKKAFKEVTDAPDVKINVNAIINSKPTVSSTSYYEYGSVYRPYTWGPGVSYIDYDVRHYKDGTLIIDVLDARLKKLLWQGIGKKEIDISSKHPEKDIPRAVELIMADFPPANKR